MEYDDIRYYLIRKEAWLLSDWKKETRDIAGEMTQVPQIRKEEIPDIELYMDQLITYLERRLSFFQRDSRTPLVTGTMVNNYSKAGLTRPANRKRYDKAHVMALSVICQLKRMLSIQDMGRVGGPLERPEEMAPVYDIFLEAQKERFAQAPALADDLIRRTEEAGIGPEDRDQALAALVIQLAAEAQRDILLAERLIDSLGRQDPPKRGREKGRGGD